MKKIFKKSLALMVSAALCLTAFVGCLTVNAETPSNTATLTVGSKEITKGTTTVTVPVTLQANDSTEIAAARFSLVIDSKFTVSDYAEEGSGFIVSSSFDSSGNPAPKSGSTYIFLIEATNDGSGKDVYTFTTAKFNLILTVPADAAAGTYAFAGYEGEDPKVAILEACDLGTATTVGEKIEYSSEHEVVIAPPTFGSVTIKAAHTHSYTELKYDETNHWYECPDDGKKDGLEAHTYGEWVVDEEASTTKEGSKHRDCSVCKYSEIATIPVIPCDHANATYDYSVVDGNCITKLVCPDCGNAETIANIESKTVTPNMVVSSGLAVRFRVKQADVTDYSNIYAKISKDKYNYGTNEYIGESDPETIPAVTQGKNWQFEYKGISSCEMTCEIHVKVFGTDTNGNVLLIASSDSAFADYLKTRLADNTGTYTVAYLNFFADALRYGAASQLFNGYRTDALATDGVDTTYGTELPTTFENTQLDSTGSVTIEPNTVLSNSVKFRIRFLKSDVSTYYDAGTLKMTIDYTNASNQAAQAVATCSDFTEASNGKKWQYEFSDLPASFVGDYFVIKLWDGDTELASLNYCFQSYASDKYNSYNGSSDAYYANLSTLCQATVAYSKSLKTALS